MAHVERVLALDIGASSLKAGEFEYSAAGITLVGFGLREYGEELSETNRDTLIGANLRQLIAEHGFTARKVLVSISGQSAFIRFVKLPPVSEEEKRIRQIVEFEAKQNVPFPMDEVIWDYQLIANPEADEMEVMFVVIKNDIVEQITHAMEAVGLSPVQVEIAPVAGFNAARMNHVGDDECAMVLNIGSRSSNLLFADRTRFFARTIPIAGNAITQQVAKEFNIGMAEAEEMKRRHGFVALGGAYEAPESEVAATVSKIVRSVMTRLHGEINRSISVYRAQQKGNRPVRLYLAGGSSTMGFTDRFFQEALNLEVSYLNPFQVISVGPRVDRQQLQAVAHMFSEVIGLGLRYRLQCPVEVSLMPKTLRRYQTFQQKKPYLAGAMACLMLVVLLGWMASLWREQKFSELQQQFDGTVRKLEGTLSSIQRDSRQAEDTRKRYDGVVALLAERQWLPEMLNDIQAMKPRDLWLTRLRPIYGDIKEVAGSTAANESSRPAGGPPGMPMFGMFPGMGGPPGGAPPGAPADNKTAGGVGASTFKITGFELSGHGVTMPEAASGNKTGGSPEQLFLERLQKAAWVDGDPKVTAINNFSVSDSTRNFSTFTLQVKLKKPLEINR
ncbi:MAG: type IV pilus assembly protein PilM [Lentisphaeria bacterium]